MDDKDLQRATADQVGCEHRKADERMWTWKKYKQFEYFCSLLGVWFYLGISFAGCFGEGVNHSNTDPAHSNGTQARHAELNGRINLNDSMARSRVGGNTDLAALPSPEHLVANVSAPGANDSPLISGSADASCLIQIYSGPHCSGLIV
jgi:hypothetical protein